MKHEPIWRCTAQIVPISLAAGLVFVYLKLPGSWEDMVRVDSHRKGGGFIEHATVTVLVVGIVHGLFALIKARKEIRNKWFTLWLCGWCLALIYFAGEEISWGQWIFKWETPETFQEINKQKETNLHNTSSWLNEKPRMMVEIWLILAGLILPFWNKLARKKERGDKKMNLIETLYPGTFGVAVVLCYAVSKALASVKTVDWCIHLGNPEVRECFIAGFLSLYLIWVFYKRTWIAEKLNDDA